MYCTLHFLHSLFQEKSSCRAWSIGGPVEFVLYFHECHRTCNFSTAWPWRKVQAPEEAPIYISDVVELEDGERERDQN